MTLKEKTADILNNQLCKCPFFYICGSEEAFQKVLAEKREKAFTLMMVYQGLGVFK